MPYYIQWKHRDQKEWHTSHKAARADTLEEARQQLRVEIEDTLLSANLGDILIEPLIGAVALAATGAAEPGAIQRVARWDHRVMETK